ncbi:MAG TPA: sigma-70 family RNA polymerase sigma factor [Stackebrandtia sp.]|jgi:RNA polymerase sigma-70 factor (ECF subfamily)|uniref:sigma-70 family RNA polymerase sigma factor n=1 Tax=Stackebrandtia sp. TaxID=2023065 RepID=UPI002D3727F7|nr:sigma-70 family RNA polymerase sigma factor [Stackebrandtia sp.]HZE40322.1 sigma-70 family RNA polymerase sigma factor [Stackebrandtia sp.]
MTNENVAPGQPAAAADEQLIHALHAEYAPALWRYALRLTRGDEARAQDAVQETLLRAWRHSRTLSGSAQHARRWLFRTLRSRVIDEWRSRAVRPEVLTDTLPEREEEDNVDNALRGLVVLEALRKISAAHREVLLECFYGGRSISEAAGRLKIPPGTVKSRLHYGLRAMKLALEEAGVVSEESQ